LDLNGATEIAAPRETVWAALNDPAVLARCIEGVERLDADGPNRFAGVLNAKVGPVKAKFSGTVELTELEPPRRYVLVGEGKGGVAGFAKGSAEVVLEELPDGGTRLSYAAKSQVGGKLAQLGTRLVEGAAKGYAESFFAAFKAEVEGPAAAPEAAAEPAADADAIRSAAVAAAAAAATSPARGLPGWAWISGLVLLVLAVLYLLF
jgi:carbon monoxide dehydrogenase subunit G